MGTTTVKNALQYESLPTSTATPTTGTQLVPNSYINTLNLTPTISWTGSLIAQSWPRLFSIQFQNLFVNGSFTGIISTASWVATSEPSVLTLDMGTVDCFSGFSFSPALLTSFSAPSLKYSLTNFSLTASGLTTLNLPLLRTILGTFSLTCLSLTTLSLPSLVSIATTSTFTMVNMTNFTLGSTLKLFASNFVLTGAKLTQASVDNILVTLAALDGTNGTTAYSSRTVNLSGGTSSTPSATGLTAKATLQARSCTVTTN